MLKVLMLGAVVGAIGFVWAGRPLFFYVLPLAWTGEAERLAAVLAIGPGASVADVGAGSGVLAAEIAKRVAPGGVVFATELNPARRQQLAERLAPYLHAKVVAASAAETNLPPECCDALYLRAVFHHVENPMDFAAAIARALRSGGRVAVMDFAPGQLPFHGADHGVDTQAVIDAFTAAGLRLAQRDDNWGGAMYMVAFRK